MKTKKIPIKDIAKAIGKNPSTVFRWLTGVRNLGIDDALDLERVTGVKAEAWAFPDRYHNPYFPKR